MTVKELMEILKEMKQDLEVCFEDWSDDSTHIRVDYVKIKNTGIREDDLNYVVLVGTATISEVL